MNILDKEFSADTPKKSGVGVALKWAVLSVLVSVIINLVMVLFDINVFAGTGKTIGYFSYIIFIAMIVLTIKDDRDNNLGGYISYGRGLGTGTLMGLFTGIFSGIWMYLLCTYISPDMIDAMIDQTREQLLTQGQSEESADDAIKMMSGFMTPAFFAISSAISVPIMYFLISLVVAAVLKKDKPMF